VSCKEEGQNGVHHLDCSWADRWLAGQVMKGGGYRVLVDIILGTLGGVLGGWVFGLLGIWPGGGILGAIIVSFVGAVILVAITRLLKRA
jgi:uncharacterized membrane protein YeaQ/YmgE (transglycosylase-associated protein family)